MKLLVRLASIIAALIALIWLLSTALGALVWVVVVGAIVGFVGWLIKLWLDSKTEKKKVAAPSQKRADKDAERDLKKIEREISKQ